MLTAKRFSFIGILLLFVVFAANLKVSDLLIASAQGQTGSISGTVFHAATGLPLSGIEVCAKSISHAAYMCASSVSTGVYSINGLPVGNYVVLVEQTGWALEYFEEAYFEQQTGEYDGADHVQVVEGMVTGGIDFALDEGASLSGTVTDGEGVPLSQIRVESLDFPAFYTCTDANGEYVLSGIPAKEEDGLNLRASVDPSCPNSHPDYAPENCFSCAQYNRQTPATGAIDFTLELGGMISGAVTSQANGLPLEGIEVCAVDDAGQSFCGLTDADGDYIIKRLPAFDAYSVRVIADGWSLEYYNDTHQKRWAAAVPVVSAQTTSDINFALEPGGVVSGTVETPEGDPLEGIQIAFILQYDGFETITDEYGHYEFASIPDQLLGKALARSYDAFGELIFQEYWEEAALESSASHIWFDEEHTEWTNVDFTLETLGVIAGEVTGTGGVPLGDVKVCAIPYYGAGDDCAWTDVNGRYWIDGLIYDPDGYKVFVDDWRFGILYYDGKTEATADPVPITYGQTVDEIDFVVETGGSVTGVVRDAGGTPLNRMRVEIAGDGWKTSTCTDENGRYIALNVPYNQSFTAFASSSLCGSKRGYQPEYWQEEQDPEQASILSVSAETPVLSGIDFSLVEQSVITSTGANQIVTLPHLSLTFAAVNQAGVTWETQLPNNPYYIIGDFDLLGYVYEAASSAHYSTPVQVCLHYDDAGLGVLEEQLRLYQYNEAWNDITLSSDYLDMDENIICGSTETRLSTFAVLLPKIAPPENVSASDGSSTGQVTISWDALSDTYSYRVFRTAPGGGEIQLGNTLNAVFNDISAVPGILYEYRVKVCIGTGDFCGLPSAAETGWRAQPEPQGQGSYDDPQVFYEGNWLITETSGAYGNTQHTSYTPGNFAVFFFEGRCAAVVFSGDPEHGVMEIYIDDVLVHTLTQYVRHPISWLQTMPICVEEGQHVFKMLHISGAIVDLNALIVGEPVEYEEEFYMPIFNGF